VRQPGTTNTVQVLIGWNLLLWGKISSALYPESLSPVVTSSQNGPRFFELISKLPFVLALYPGSCVSILCVRQCIGEPCTGKWGICQAVALCPRHKPAYWFAIRLCKLGWGNRKWPVKIPVYNNLINCSWYYIALVSPILIIFVSFYFDKWKKVWCDKLQFLV